MKPRFGIVRSAAVLALAAGAIALLSATAHAQLLKNMNNTNFSGPYACRGAGMVDGSSVSYEFVFAPTGYGIFTGGSLLFQDPVELQECTLDTAHSGYQVIADGEGIWEISWNCDYAEFADVGYFNGALPPTPTGHFEEIRFADELSELGETWALPSIIVAGSGNCHRQLP